MRAQAVRRTPEFDLRFCGRFDFKWAKQTVVFP
jgi:hypothetical protein